MTRTLYYRWDVDGENRTGDNWPLTGTADTEQEAREEAEEARKTLIADGYIYGVTVTVAPVR